MKKILTAMVLSLLLVLGACSPASLSYLDQVSKTSKWTNYTQEGHVTVKIETKDDDGKDLNITIPAEFKSTAEGVKGKVDIKYDLKSLKESLQSVIENPESNLDLPDELKLTVFANGTKIAVKKSDILQLGDDIVPNEIKNIKEEYIGFDSTGQEDMDQKKLEEYVKSEEFKADMLKLIKDGLDGFKASKEMTVEKNTYNYEATLEEALDDFEDAVETLAKNRDKVATTVADMAAKMGYKDVTVDKVKTELAKIKSDDLDDALDSDDELKDSKVKFSTTFGENTMDQCFSMKFKIKDLGTVSVETTTKTVKDDKAKVSYPTSVKYYTQEDLMKSVAPNQGPMFLVTLNDDFVEFEDVQPIIKDNRTLVPFRAILEKAGAKVDWNQEDKKVTAELDGKKIEMTIGQKKIMVDGKEVELDVAPMIKEGRTLIPLRGMFENLGFEVEYEKVGQIHSIEIEK